MIGTLGSFSIGDHVIGELGDICGRDLGGLGTWGRPGCLAPLARRFVYGKLEQQRVDR
jgi:hypothetical protein